MSWWAQRGHERAQRVVASSCIPALAIRRLRAAPAA